MGWVRLHPYNIAQKVQIVVEHFREHVAPLLNGRAKAMVVVGSRKEAVRWQAGHRQVHQGSRLPDRNARGVLGRGERPGVRPRCLHGTQRHAEPEPARPRHPRSLQHRRVPDPAGREQVPDRVRPAAAVRHVRRQAAGGHSGRADAVPAESRPSRQGHDLCARLRERRRQRSSRRSRPTTRRPSCRT